MKYFKQDILARFASKDESVAMAAQEELEAQSERYAEHLNKIKDKLPVRFRELQEQYYLHDSRVVMHWPPDYSTVEIGLPWNSLINWGGSLKIMYTPLAMMTLELDTPPKELLVLNYRYARIAGWAPFELRGERPPYLEWEHDEIDIFEREGVTEVMQTVLFSNGFELQMWFSDFDFAVLKPFARQKEMDILRATGT